MIHARISETAKLVCTKHLAEFIERTPGVIFAQLSTADGFEVASQPKSKLVPAKLAAMSSSMQALSEVLLAESGLHDSRNVIIESADGYLILMAVPGVEPPMALLVVANRSSIMGHLLWAAKSCSAMLGKLLTH